MEGEDALVSEKAVTAEPTQAWSLLEAGKWGSVPRVCPTEDEGQPPGLQEWSLRGSPGLMQECRECSFPLSQGESPEKGSGRI